MILLSAHLDRVIQDYDLRYEKGTHQGLLDNFLGVLLTYLVLYDDHNVQRLEQEGRLKVWHGKGEEWGRLDGAPKLTKRDLAIVVDICAGKDYEGKDFGIGNISGLSAKACRDLKADLTWQGFAFAWYRYQGHYHQQDESWEWRKRGVPTFSFEIPITAVSDGWHRIQQDNTADVGQMLKCRQALKRIICHFSEEH